VSSSTTIHEIVTLVRSRHPVVVIDTVEEDRARDIVVAAGGNLDLPVFEWSMTHGFRRVGDESINGMTTSPDALLAHLADLTVEALFLLKDLHPHLAQPVVERRFRDVASRFAQSHSTMVLLGARIELPPSVDADAIRVALALPGRPELEQVARVVLRSAGVTVPERGVDALLAAVQGLTLNQARQTVAAAVLDGMLTPGDVKDVLERKVQTISEGGLLEYHPAEDNAFELAGMANLKEWLDRASLAFGPEAKAMNIPAPKGILLAGVPGCGKSLAAKFVARRWGRPLLKLDAGSLYDKYVGESERNLRRAIDVAESLAPIVLWIDEVEKGLSSGGDDAGGATARRMLGTLLTWMQEKREDIFVVATSNDLTALPPELQRKGRFDEVFFVDLPTAEEREAIFDIHLKLRRQNPVAFDLGALVGASEGFSGSEIEQSVVSGLLRALHDRRAPDTAAVLEEVRATVPLARSRPEAVDALRARSRDLVPAG
jgi:ATPase family associated with various cellular activities (AAA)